MFLLNGKTETEGNFNSNLIVSGGFCKEIRWKCDVMAIVWNCIIAYKATK